MSHGAAPSAQRIVLVGFMASGKSTVGRLLARRLGWDFVDLDEEVRRRTGRTAAELIRQDGVGALREIEASATDELAGRTRMVLAPGGGWALRPHLAGRLGPGTVRVWLRLSAEEAARRSREQGMDRPLLEGPDGDVAAAAALLEEREPFYAAAELTIDVEEKDPRAVVDEILRRIRVDTGGC